MQNRNTILIALLGDSKARLNFVRELNNSEQPILPHSLYYFPENFGTISEFKILADLTLETLRPNNGITSFICFNLSEETKAQYKEPGQNWVDYNPALTAEECIIDSILHKKIHNIELVSDIQTKTALLVTATMDENSNLYAKDFPKEITHLHIGQKYFDLEFANQFASLRFFKSKETIDKIPELLKEVTQAPALNN